jgi:hypothetical protein
MNLGPLKKNKYTRSVKYLESTNTAVYKIYHKQECIFSEVVEPNFIDAFYSNEHQVVRLLARANKKSLKAMQAFINNEINREYTL